MATSSSDMPSFLQLSFSTLISFLFTNFLNSFRSVVVEKKKLAMVSGSFYLPKRKKWRPEGEDAHFICSERQTIGVADGVGSWSKKGVDAGAYARELVSNVKIALLNEPVESVDPIRALKTAHSQTTVPGSSTICILTLLDNDLHVVNVGDSGFVLISKGEDVYQSPVQHYSYNRPYQLNNTGDKATSPEIAHVFTVPAQAGDVIVAGTDGLLDNLFPHEINEVCRKGIQQEMDPHDIAKIIAHHAYHSSIDRNAHTPCAEAAREARRKQRGGKSDDITVIVSFIVEA